MALISCNECSKEVSQFAKVCQNCGNQVNKPAKGALEILFIILFFLYNIAMALLAVQFIEQHKDGALWFVATLSSISTFDYFGTFDPSLIFSAVFILFIWLIGAVILGLAALMLRRVK